MGPLYNGVPLYNGGPVRLMEVSFEFVEGSFNEIKYQNGTRKCPLLGLVVRCPLLSGIHYIWGVMMYLLQVQK